MRLSLSAILVMVLFVILRFGGDETRPSPFAERPGVPAHEIMLAVDPLNSQSSGRPVAIPLPTAGTAGDRLAAEVTETAAAPAPNATPNPVPVPSADPAPPSSPVPSDETEITAEERAVATIAEAQAALDRATRLAEEAEGILDNTDAGLSRLLGNAPSLGSPAPTRLLDPNASEARAEVTGSTVNLRAGPSTGNAVLGRAARGDVVTWISNPVPGWALIRHPDIDQDVFMSAQYLRRLDN